eukprot:364111-Chlamydomonas_euryale.AAC.4
MACPYSVRKGGGCGVHFQRLGSKTPETADVHKLCEKCSVCGNGIITTFSGFGRMYGAALRPSPAHTSKHAPLCHFPTSYQYSNMSTFDPRHA